MGGSAALHRRLLRDIAEIQNNPYPNIAFHVNENLTEACLILTPNGTASLHLEMKLEGYPLRAPTVTIQSAINHPNVLGNYICASILNTQEGYTPAYTLKSIAIQLLSFFNSDTLEQEGGTHSVDLLKYKSQYTRLSRCYRCNDCGFDDGARLQCNHDLFGHVVPNPLPGPSITHPNHRQIASIGSHAGKVESVNATKFLNHGTLDEDSRMDDYNPASLLTTLPDEVLLLIFEKLSTKDLTATSHAIPKAHEILNSYDFIRLRELQCFCLKESFLDLQLGIGVHIARRGREGTLESEFDLLSHGGFFNHKVRQSIQGLHFEHWLPLPLSRRHWRRVQPRIDIQFKNLAKHARFSDCSDFSVLSHFLNDIVVKFSQEAERSYSHKAQSTLTHASEKAVESYFALFHLLLCLATEQSRMIESANHKISYFLSGQKSKAACPNLGHLLVATLISRDGLTEELSLAIINEAILRNVVWMLDLKGANMPELSYLEPSAVSEYRVRKTFQASLTSYRLLMFCSLFCKSARSDLIKPLASLRDELFDTHGAPPRGTAEQMAREIRRIKTIDSFPLFLQEMGLKDVPEQSEFTSFLRRMVEESVEVGYSRMPISQGEALALRKSVDPSVEIAEGVLQSETIPGLERLSFFPNYKERRYGRHYGGGRFG